MRGAHPPSGNTPATSPPAALPDGGVTVKDGKASTSEKKVRDIKRKSYLMNDELIERIID